MIPNNARALRLTAAAGTELAGASSGGTVRPEACSTPGGSSPLTAVYTPKGVLPHAASLGQPCGHCPRFPTAASRRSLGRVSVPMWRIILSDPLAVVALVGRDPTNQLIARKLLPAQWLPWRGHLSRPSQATPSVHAVLARVSPGCPPHRGRLLTCYAPVRRSAPPPKGRSSRDLHVLSTPPAFVLSQDQTLH